MMKKLLEENPPPEQDQGPEGANPQTHSTPGGQTPPADRDIILPAPGEQQ